MYFPETEPSKFPVPQRKQRDPSKKQPMFSARGCRKRPAHPPTGRHSRSYRRRKPPDLLSDTDSRLSRLPFHIVLYNRCRKSLPRSFSARRKTHFQSLRCIHWSPRTLSSATSHSYLHKLLRSWYRSKWSLRGIHSCFRSTLVRRCSNFPCWDELHTKSYTDRLYRHFQSDSNADFPETSPNPAPELSPMGRNRHCSPVCPTGYTPCPGLSALPYSN